MASQPQVSRDDRLQAAERLDQAAEWLDELAAWYDRVGGDLDKVSVYLECAARDCRAGAWLLKPADHSRPPDYLSSPNGHQPRP